MPGDVSAKFDEGPIPTDHDDGGREEVNQLLTGVGSIYDTMINSHSMSKQWQHSSKCKEQKKEETRLHEEAWLTRLQLVRANL